MTTTDGEKAYQQWRDALLSDPEGLETYLKEAKKKELWILLADTARLNEEKYPPLYFERMLEMPKEIAATLYHFGYGAFPVEALYAFAQQLGIETA